MPRPDGAHGGEDLQGESQPRRDVAAVVILTAIRERRQKAAEQVAVGQVKFQHIEARFQPELRGSNEFFANRIHVCAGHRARDLADTRHVRQSRRGEQRPIARGLAGPGLLAHVLVSKYCDHLPLYRQCEIYARQGLELDRSTL